MCILVPKNEPRDLDLEKKNPKTLGPFAFQYLFRGSCDVVDRTQSQFCGIISIFSLCYKELV